MFFRFYEYKNLTFAIRDCTFTHNGKTLSGVFVSSEDVYKMFFNENGDFADEEAEHLDSMIQYYIPHEKLHNLSDDEILDYIYKYVDGEIYDDFV